MDRPSSTLLTEECRPATFRRRSTDDQVILIVDDMPENLSVLGELLYGAGYRVKVATNGVAALNLANQHPRPSLVLLDVMMPKKSGFEVCQEIKADPALAAVRILMLTAKGRDTEVAKGLALGADAYMTKPFSTKELVEKVRSMLGD